MHEHEADFGTGEKKLGIYVLGFTLCSILTLIAFFTVMANTLPKWAAYSIIYPAALIQFLVQVICFLRLNTQTEQGRINVMSIIFTIIILGTIVVGSLWIMWSLQYNMMH